MNAFGAMCRRFQADRPAFLRVLEGLGYPYWDESANPAYKLFLA